MDIERDVPTLELIRPGWYHDPNTGQDRWFNGKAWTDSYLRPDLPAEEPER